MKMMNIIVFFNLLFIDKWLCYIKKKFIDCTNWKPREKNHRFLTIPLNIDLELLEKMFNKHLYHSNGIVFEVNLLNYFNFIYINIKLINTYI